jgi:hypothetical protein
MRFVMWDVFKLFIAGVVIALILAALYAYALGA